MEEEYLRFTIVVTEDKVQSNTYTYMINMQLTLC